MCSTCHRPVKEKLYSQSFPACVSSLPCVCPALGDIPVPQMGGCSIQSILGLFIFGEMVLFIESSFACDSWMRLFINDHCLAQVILNAGPASTWLLLITLL